MANEFPPGPKFVTGADQKYFFMCGILHESLKKYAPGIPLYVMDFGLSEGQKSILEKSGMLLPLPSGLEAGLPPSRLKSSIDLFTGGGAGPWVWIDADMMAVRECRRQLEDLLGSLGDDGTRLAVSGDPDPEWTLGAFSVRFDAPKLQLRLRLDPELREAPYVRSSIVFFLDDALLPEWRDLAAQFEEDVCWDQNALCILAHSIGAGTRVIDPRTWNVHAMMIDELAGAADGLTCGGIETCFVHVSSREPRHLAEFSFPVLVDGQSIQGYTRMFTHPRLRQMQVDFLMNFLQAHPVLKAA